jgi:hypothetical protein
MHQPIEFKAKAPFIRKPVNQSDAVLPCRIITLLFICFGLKPMNAFGIVPVA